MKNYEQIIKQLIETSPSWEKDGGGVRGRTIAPIVSGLSSSIGMADFVPQQFNQSNNETIQRSAQDPVADLILGDGGGDGTTLGPWDLTSVEEANRYLVTVRAGTLNGILPSNWNTFGQAQDVPCNKDTLYYAKAIIQTDGTEIISVEILINTQPPQIQKVEVFSVDRTVEYLFGLFRNGTAYRTIAEGHIVIQPRIWLTTDKDQPAQAGELPYQFYYRLQ